MADEPTVSDLRARARELEIEGRSSMDADELAAAIAAVEAEPALEPSSDDVVGRPPVVDVAEERAARRAQTMRVIGAPTKEA